MARSTSETGSGISSSLICIGVEPPLACSGTRDHSIRPPASAHCRVACPLSTRAAQPDLPPIGRPSETRKDLDVVDNIDVHAVRSLAGSSTPGWSGLAYGMKCTGHHGGGL